MTRIDSLAGRLAYLGTHVSIYTLNAFAPFAPALTRLFELIDAGQLRALTSELTLAELLVKPLRDSDVAASADMPVDATEQSSTVAASDHAADADGIGATSGDHTIEAA